MITFIPIELYGKLYYYVLMNVVILVSLQSAKQSIDDNYNIKTKRSLGIILLLFVLFYMGLRPINGKYFGDMRTYANRFDLYAAGEPIMVSKDVFFDYFMKFCTTIMTVETFFFICALLYIVPLYTASKRLFNDYWFYSFLMLVVSFSFWGYGTNGIRNGIATSLFILAVTQRHRWQIYTIFFFAVAFHQSLIIPVIAYIISCCYNKPSVFLKVWLFAIPLSLALGSFWEGFFMNIGIFDTERGQGYLTGGEEYAQEFSSTGFRWDFLLYSATGVYAGWYFITKKKFADPLYAQLFNVYLIANAFWILVIRANFSNRFAYLSWFLLGIIIIYPFLINRFFSNQHNIVGRIIVLYFLFTFILNVVL